MTKALLAHGDRGWVQKLNFFVCAVFALCFTVGVARATDPKPAIA